MPEFNYPQPDDPQFGDKIVNLFKQLFEKSDKGSIDLTPMDVPTEGLQIGTLFYDQTAHKLKVNTATGVKTITFDP